ncbi:hypothetical protein MAHJHV65_25950 [Mycobacterium avium subsp. hominissuis]
MLDSALPVGGEVNQPVLTVPRNQLGQPGLENRDTACEEQIDLGLIDIDTDDIVAAIRETGARDEAYIA